MRYTEQQIKYIKENYIDITPKKIAENLGVSYSGVCGVIKRYNLYLPKHIAEQRKKDSYFKKGNKPFNKGLKITDYTSIENIEKIKATQFKKGNKPHNTKFDGYERITKDGYIEIRLSEGLFKLKHIYEWEKVNESLKKGYCLWCLDGNKKNTDPSNWELITRKENLRRNVHCLPDELNRAKRLLTRINKQL